MWRTVIYIVFFDLPMAALRETEPPPCLLLHNTYSMPSNELYDHNK
jgi:hypothetical protein